MLGIVRLQQILDSFSLWNETDPNGPKSATNKDSLEGRVLRVHHFNCLLWENEDQARRSDLGDARQVAIKRESHRLNQARNDAIEQVDEWLLEHHYGELADLDLPLRTETPGSVFDRLSILSLKIFHMGRQLERPDVDEDHILRCRHKLNVLECQRRDLESAFRQMVEDLNDGKIRMKIYRQFKMYNDPALNPHLQNARQDKPATGE